MSTTTGKAMATHNKLQKLADAGIDPQKRLASFGVDCNDLMDYAQEFAFTTLAEYGNSNAVLNIGQALMVGISIGFEIGLEHTEAPVNDSE